jgi:hypothetical protein
MTLDDTGLGALFTTVAKTPSTGRRVELTYLGSVRLQLGALPPAVLRICKMFTAGSRWPERADASFT